MGLDTASKVKSALKSLQTQGLSSVFFSIQHLTRDILKYPTMKHHKDFRDPALAKHLFIYKGEQFSFVSSNSKIHPEFEKEQ